MLYFAYGSNLERGDLERWCEAKSLPPLQLEPVGIAYLADRRLAFTHRSHARGGGVLDIPHQRGSTVAGVLFRVPHARDLEALDRKEGEGHTYRRIAWFALDEMGREHEVATYEVQPEHSEPFVGPTEEYLQIVRRGYAAHRLDTAGLEAAARNSSYPGAVAKLFVYGTLMQGEARHPALVRHRARLEGSGQTAGTLLDLGDYPGLIPMPSARPVRGELYAADDRDALFRELDAIEVFKGWGVAGSHYRRAIVRVADPDGGSVLAWTYFFTAGRDAGRIIASGDWRRRQHVS